MLSDLCPVLYALCVLSLCDVGVLWPNGWMDQDKTWHAARPRPWPPCVRWGPSLSQKVHSPPIFGPCPLWPNGWMDQDATWYGGRPLTRRHCVRWGPSFPPKRGHSPVLHQFLAHVCCGQMAGWIKMPLGMEVGLGPGDFVRWVPATPNFQSMSVVAKRLDGSRCHLVRQ